MLGVGRHREALLASGQHLKRGLLLYGPPGTGKTHTIRYLLGRTTDTTVVQLTGDALRMISAACSVARALTPSMIVVEDVDLIAEDRESYGGRSSLLFELLIEMDGLGEDADVAFVLTTNRADLLEAALANRPGRVDQAVELGLPDEAARRALLDLYRGALRVPPARSTAPPPRPTASPHRSSRSCCAAPPSSPRTPDRPPSTRPPPSRSRPRTWTRRWPSSWRRGTP